MISFRQKGDFSKTFLFLEKAKHAVHLGQFDKYGEAGVAALSSATPVDTGLTANSWYYEVTYEKDSVTISFRNSNIQNGIPVAILIQNGHATRNGYWIEGRDYINPAIQPIFENIAESIWKEVTEA